MLRVCAMLLLAAFISGCSGSSGVQQERIPVGWVDRSIFDNPAYTPFKTAYDSAHVGAEYVDLVRKSQSGIDVIVFFGVWCSDSKREVPRFLRLTDLTGFPATRLKFYSLDRSKKSPDGLTEKYGIERVPTFVFLKSGQEVGRIVESPQTTMEGDVLAILARAR